MSLDTQNYNVQNSELRPVTVKKTDFKDLKTGEDFRSQAQGGTNPLKGNDTQVRGETTNDENAGA